MMPNNRELASAILVAILLMCGLTKRDVRNALMNVITAFFTVKIIVPLAMFVLWMAGWIFLAAHFGVWTSSLLADTILWIAISGLTLFFNATRAAEGRHFFLDALRSTVTVSALMNFFLTVRTFGLGVELIIQPVIVGLAMMQVVAASEKRYALTKKVLDAVAAIVGLTIVAATAVQLVRYANTLDPALISQSFAMTIWLPLVALPFVFVFGLIAEYELAFIRMEFAGIKVSPSIMARLAVVLGLNVQIRDVRKFKGGWAARAKSAPTFRLAFNEVNHFKQHCLAEERDRREHEIQLKRFAGSDAEDEEGRRLDQREFLATQSALRWLAIYHMGWHERNDHRYRADLLDIVAPFKSQGLPDEHGVVMKVRRDGHAWYAWRRTITGWIFAIGALDDPRELWFYDGRNPPKGFPGEKTDWDCQVPGSNSRNWT